MTKTTIDIPEPFYRKAKINAIERKQTLKQLVLQALQRELDLSVEGDAKQQTFGGRRNFIPSYEKAAKAGAFSPPPGACDITTSISEDRNDR